MRNPADKHIQLENTQGTTICPGGSANFGIMSVLCSKLPSCQHVYNSCNSRIVSSCVLFPHALVCACTSEACVCTQFKSRQALKFAMQVFTVDPRLSRARISEDLLYDNQVEQICD